MNDVYLPYFVFHVHDCHLSVIRARNGIRLFSIPHLTMAVDICITILKMCSLLFTKVYLLNIICLLPAKNVIADVCLQLISLLFRALIL